MSGNGRKYNEKVQSIPRRKLRKIVGENFICQCLILETEETKGKDEEIRKKK